MKYFLTSLLLVLVSLASLAQTTTASDRVVVRQSLYLKRWVDSIQNDTNFINRVNAVPTSDAVYRFFKRSIGNAVNYNTYSTSTTILSDTTILICSGNNVCDTVHYTSTVVNAQNNSSYLANDSTLIVCDSLQHCDTITIPKQQLLLFQNGTRMISTGIVEFGGTLLHPTELFTGYNHLDLTGMKVYDYPYRFKAILDWQEGTGIASFSHSGGWDTSGNFVYNKVRLGINFTGDMYGSVLDSGYFGRSIGFFMGVNGTGNGSYGLRVDDTTSKIGGIFFHTNDNSTADAVTIYGLPRQNNTMVGGSLGVDPTLTKSRITTFKNNRQLRWWGYGNNGFRVNDTTSYKPVTVDSNGDLWQSNWPVGGSTLTNTVNVVAGYGLIVPEIAQAVNLNPVHTPRVDTAALRAWITTFSSTGGVINNTNISTGYRWLIPSSQALKTFFPGYGIILDSTTNANGLTATVDTTASGLATYNYVTNTFNTYNLGKQTKLTLTTTGKSGASALDNSGNMNIPNYSNTSLGGGYKLLDSIAQGIKSLRPGLYTSLDSTTSGEVKVNVDSATLGPWVRTQVGSGGGGGGSTAVDSIYRTPGKDSIQFTIAGRYHAIKDSTGQSRRFAFTGEDASGNENRTFTMNAGYSMTLAGNYTSTTGYMYNISNSSTSGGGVGISTAGSGASISSQNSSNGDAVFASANNSGTAIHAISKTGLTALFDQTSQSGSDGSIVEQMQFIRHTSSGSVSNGIGIQLGFKIQSSSGSSFWANTLQSKWMDATTATRTSRMVIQGYNSATFQDVLYINGNGDLELPVVGSGVILKSPDGTKRARLSIDNTGALVVTAL